MKLNRLDFIQQTVVQWPFSHFNDKNQKYHFRTEMFCDTPVNYGNLYSH